MDKLKQSLLSWVLDIVDKLHEVTTSAKFWTMIMSDASSWSLYENHQITAPMFLAAVVAAGIGYSGAKAYEDAHVIKAS